MWSRLHSGVAGLVIVLLFALQPAQAAVVRAYNGKVNTAASGVVQSKIGKLGFAANDPRFGATIAGAGASLTTIATGVAVGGAAAVSWPVLLAGAAVAGVVTGAVTLGQGAMIDWLYGDDETVTLSGQGMGTSDGSNLGLMPSSYIDLLDQYGAGQDLYFRESGGKIRHIKTLGFACPASGTCANPEPFAQPLDWTFSQYYPGPYPGPNGYWANSYNRTVGTGETRQRQTVYSFVPPTLTPVAPPSYEPVPKPVVEAIADVPDAVAETQLSPEMLAAISNASWKAAQTQSNALPWPATDPITAQDVKDWLAQNPDKAPTVGDFLAEASPTTDNKVPFPMPETSTNPNPTPTPGEGEKVDFGDDPNTPPPSMEPTPTAQAILSPILNLMPDIKNFAVPAHASECPKPTMSVFNREYRLEAHCDLIEQNRAPFEAAMLLVWTLAALFIVLRA
ncbi:hypothetical protein D3C81_444140 [compost metagenome]